jgi:hypothetical protein
LELPPIWRTEALQSPRAVAKITAVAVAAEVGSSRSVLWSRWRAILVGNFAIANPQLEQNDPRKRAATQTAATARFPTRA